MPLLHVLVLAVVQGVAEFLPISSSGHLVIVAALLSPTGSTKGLDVGDVNIVLHVGTLLSILVYYWHRLLRLFRSERRLIGLLIVGTLPAVIVGLTVKRTCETLLENTLLAGAMLLVTGMVLIIAARTPLRSGSCHQLNYRQALIIGISQAIAILPGVSRSGVTISTGLGVGLSRQDAATFSFLLAIPVIAGAGALEMQDLVGGASVTTPWINLVVGATVAFVVGLFSLWWFLRWLQKGRLEYFAYWCILVGASVVGWQLTR